MHDLIARFLAESEDSGEYRNIVEKIVKSKMSSVAMLAVIALAMFVGAAPSAYADSVTLNLNQSAAFGAATYGTVDLTLNGSSIDVDIKLVNGWVVDTGGHFAVSFNESIAGNPALSLSGLETGYAFVNLANTPVGSAGAYDLSGVGTFEFAISGPSAAAGSDKVPELTFTVSRVSGVFSSVFDLIEVQSDSKRPAAVFAVDILQGAPCTANCTGLVYATTPTVSTPEPASIMLLGFGLIALGGVAKLRRKKLN